MNTNRRLVWVTLAAALACLATASLGFWQLGRAEEKLARQASLDQRALEPVLLAGQLDASVVAPELSYRRIEARGHWLSERTIYLDNRPMNSRVGFYVVTPLQLQASAEVVLVLRGWAARDFQERSRLPPVDTPSGLVSVAGRIAPALARLYDMGGPDTGQIRQNLDLAQYRAESGLALASYIVQQTGEPSEGLQRDWPQISTGVDKHYGYAFQWFGLSALIAVLYVWFQFVRNRQQRSA
ncbi:MAG: hypothetical protein RL468_928 [Pseudomonadota bacterium]